MNYSWWHTWRQHSHRSALRWHRVLTKRAAPLFIQYRGPLFWPLAQLVIWPLPKPAGINPLTIPEPSAPLTALLNKREDTDCFQPRTDGLGFS